MTRPCQVNTAYRSLKLPLTRAVKLLEIHGDPIDEDTDLDDMEFLMETFEMNEASFRVCHHHHSS